MKPFIIKSLFFVLATLLMVYMIFSSTNGKSDPFYLRFTSPQQHSLILGTSRAAQGIQPKILNETLNRKDFYNYSFTVLHSPYGPYYLNSIKKKINPDTKDALFIVTVDPWSISSKSKHPNDSNSFREKSSFIGELQQVNSNPNILYLLNHYDGNYFKIFKPNDEMVLHEDGWLEVTISMKENEVIKRTEAKINMYNNEMLPHFKYSNIRFEYLKKTIAFLNQYGKVYLVRMPIADEILDTENKLVEP
ncbi:MAG: hypothetical protein RQ875_10780 [Vicingaceae bacterium]|nr:hypothetical protein [Vicingaceae bacterium]